MMRRDLNIVKRLFWSLSLFTLLWMPFVPAQAAFEDIGTGARGTSLGDAYVAMGDDLLSLSYNPAALARVQQKEVTTEYAKLFSGLSDGSNLGQTYLSYGQPIKWGGTLAVGWKQFALDDLYKERTLSLGYGEWLTQDIAIGGTLKQLYHSFGVPNQVVDNNGNVQSGTPNFFNKYGNSQTAYGADLGMLYRWTERHTLGLSIMNINEPNVALSSEDHEIVPRELRAALAYQQRKNVTFGGALETLHSLSNTNDLIATAAAERTFDLSENDQAAARGSFAKGAHGFSQVSIGAGYRLGSMQFDYAFQFNLGGIDLGDTAGTHRFSFTYRFGPVGPAAKTPAQAKKRKAAQMPEEFEPATHGDQVPATAPETTHGRSLPKSADITITPEELEDNSTGTKSVDITIGVIFDSDYDGIPDDNDLCPDTTPGVEVNADGCSKTQIDHHGHPLPRKVDIHFLPVGTGRKAQ